MRRYARSSPRVLAVVLVALLVLTAATGCASGDSPQADVAKSRLDLTSLEMVSGPRSGYQNVIIRGTGFAGVTRVDFGSAEALDFTVVDPTQIIAKTPPGEAGRVVDVAVSTEAETSVMAEAYTH